MPSAGTRLGYYELAEPLGAGGMGEVWRAQDTKLNRTVAVKFLSERHVDPASRRRFQREAQMASSLNHPHILTVYDAGECEGVPYLVTEFVDGGTLKEWASKKTRPWPELVELLIGIADALATAHEARILHRDIKPANILISRSGYAKLADFGLAKLVESDPAVRTDDHTRTLTAEGTLPGTILGTVAYMSPEQASGQPANERSDVFSFGIVLYELLAGRRPFTGATDIDILQAILRAAPSPLVPEIPAKLRAIVDRSLQKEPAGRYQSMREMSGDLRALTRLSAESHSAPPRTAEKRHAVRWLVGAIAVALVVAGAYRAVQSRTPAPPSRPDYIQLTSFSDSASQPALSADGRMLAFIRGESTFLGPGQVYVKVLPNGDPVQLTSDKSLKMYPRFSPDGTLVAYTALGPTMAWEVWKVPVLGRESPRLLIGNAEGLNWIPETNPLNVLFSYLTGKGVTMGIAVSTESRSEVRTVHVEDGIMDHFAFLSPDRKQLVLAEMGFDGWQPCRVLPFDGSSKGRKVGPQPAECTAAAWSPDGKWMYFSANAGNGFHIWRQRFPDGAPEQFTFGATEEEGVEMAADGRSFLTAIGAMQSTLWLHDARRDRQVTSEGYSYSPVFSSDGNKLYYLVRAQGDSSTDPRGGLWVTDLASGERRRLLADYSILHFSVSRDEQRVLFVSTEAARQGVWLASLDGRSAPRRLSSQKGFQAFFGRRGDLYFAAQDSGGTFMYRVNEDGTDLRKIVPGRIHFLYAVSPDGKYLAAWTPGPDGENGVLTQLFPVDGGSPIIVCQCGGRAGGDSPQMVNWSPDGKLIYLYFWSLATYTVPLGAGQVVPPLPPGGIRSADEVSSLPGAKKLGVTSAFASPNPQVYAYAKTSAHRNIYRVPIP